MWRGLRVVVVVAGLVLLAGCATLPRSAAVQGEILRNSTSDTRDIAVVQVTRAGLGAIGRWPASVGSGGQDTGSWLPRSAGPDSPVIRPGDSISLTVWDNDPSSLLTPEGAKQVRIEALPVSPQGTIFVPYLEEVVVNGQTPDQARRRIQEQLDAILPSAQVQLILGAGRRSSVDLLGGVGTPGSYPLPDRNFSVLNLIAAGGGVAGLENPQVRLTRDGRVHRIALERLQDDPRLDTILRGGDSVSLEEDRRRFIALGAAGQQNVIPFGRGQVTALEAVSMIGGVSGDRGAPGGILVLREYAPAAVDPEGVRGPDRDRVVFALDLTTADGLFSARNFTIAPDDLVLVTEAPVTSLRTILGLVGQGFGVAARLE
ncbi:polysaccharide biosynthesis/export family protein [Rhodobaculum claviforme]|uniref:polysaccharide biosynthesis/export family protein n=1 Tax=Rhodobaculum claviforme TaxID=1549854 RepID=UPI0030843414